MNSNAAWIAEPRARRAVAVMTIAVLAIIAAGVIYLHPSFGSKPPRRVLVGAPASPTPPQLDGRFSAAYDFVTPTLGWSLVTQNTGNSPQFWVFKTTDGAKHWSQQLASTCLNLGASHLRFFDTSHGVVDLCDPLVVFRTSDGGASWASFGLPSSPSPGFLTFGDPEHAWYLTWTVDLPADAALQPAVPRVVDFRTTADGGATWNFLPAPPLPSFSGKGGDFSIHFVDGLSGWIGGTSATQPTAYSTRDGGRTWLAHDLPTSTTQQVPFNGPVQAQVDIEPLPHGGVLAVTSDPTGSIKGFTSLDGGSTWRETGAPPTEAGFSNIVFVDDAHWWVMFNDVLYKSSDAGETWKEVTVLLDQAEHLPGVIDSKHAWALVVAPLINGPSAQGDGLAMTSDGGLHWRYVSVPQPRLS